MTQYRLKLTALSPIHIGAGEDYVPTSYIIDNGYLYEFDEQKFYHKLSDTAKQRFSTTVGNGIDAIKRFYSDEKELAKSLALQKISISKIIENIYYNKNEHRKTDKKAKNALEIEKTIKEKNSHRAYLPGSSLKGVIETALDIYQPRSSNDERQQLIVSDFQLIEGSTKIGYSKRKHKYKTADGKGIPNLLEAISSQSEFVGTIAIKKVDNAPQPPSYDTIKEALCAFIERVDSDHYAKYKTKHSGDEKSFVFRIGKFVGKSYMVPHPRRDDKDPVTHSLFTMDDLVFEPFGWVNCELIEESEYQEYIDKYTSELQEVKTKYSAYHKEQEEARNALRQAEEEKRKRLEEESAKKAKEEADELEKLAAMSPVDKLIYSYSDIAILINDMRSGTIENFEDIKVELAKKVKIVLEKDSKTWVNAKQKALKRKQYIQEILEE